MDRSYAEAGDCGYSAGGHLRKVFQSGRGSKHLKIKHQPNAVLAVSSRKSSKSRVGHFDQAQVKFVELI